MNGYTLTKYLTVFGNLHRNKGTAPHKPVLLISMLDEIDRGHITDNQILLSLELVAAFRENWDALPLPPGNWLQRVWTPFRYLIQEGFWELVKDGRPLAAKEIGDPHSVTDLNGRVNYARLSQDLWELLQDMVARNALRQHLLHVCFGIGLNQPMPLMSPNPVSSQLQKLIRESQSQPRERAPKDKADGTAYFVRHALFPQVIRAVYDDHCAVCGLEARTDTRSVIESAHIKPFANFHDDHPSNGLALCKNHHWGFDAGGFSIADDYTLIVSTRLAYSPSYLNAGNRILLPSSENCYPSPSSMAYHRENTFLK